MESVTALSQEPAIVAGNATANVNIGAGVAGQPMASDRSGLLNLEFLDFLNFDTVSETLLDPKILLRVTDYAMWIAAGVIIGLIIRSIIRVASGHSRPTRLSSAVILSFILAAAYVGLWHHYGWIPTLEPLLWATSHALTLAASLFWILRRWDRPPPEPIGDFDDATLLLESDDDYIIEKRRRALASRLNESLERDQSPRPLTARLTRNADQVTINQNHGNQSNGQNSDIPWINDPKPTPPRRRSRRGTVQRETRHAAPQSNNGAQLNDRVAVTNTAANRSSKTNQGKQIDPGREAASARPAQIPPRRSERQQRSFIKQPPAHATQAAMTNEGDASYRETPTTTQRREPEHVKRRNATATTESRVLDDAEQNHTGTDNRRDSHVANVARGRNSDPHLQPSTGDDTTHARNLKTRPPASAQDSKAKLAFEEPLSASVYAASRSEQTSTPHETANGTTPTSGDQTAAAGQNIGVLDSPPLTLSKEQSEIESLESANRPAVEQTADHSNNFLNPTRSAAATGADTSIKAEPVHVNANPGASPGASPATLKNGTDVTLPGSTSTISVSTVETNGKDATPDTPPPANVDSSDDTSNYYYELAWSELQSGKMHQALWAKAYSNADGEDAKARAWYIRYRVSQLESQRRSSQTDAGGNSNQTRASTQNQSAVSASVHEKAGSNQPQPQRTYTHVDDTEILNCKCCSHALMSDEITATGIATVACKSCGQYSDVYTVNQEPILVKAHPHLTQSGSCIFCSDMGDTDAKLSDGSEYHESCYERLLLEFDELVEDHSSDRKATATYRAALHRVYDHWPDFPPDWAIRRQGKIIENQQCHVCDGRKNLELIHKTSLQRGGSNLPNNLELICRSCWETRQASLTRAAAPAGRPLGA